jgi:penicillin-binding protein 2
MIDVPERQPDLSRVRIFGLIITVGLLSLIGRLWYLQIAHGDELLEASIMNQRRLIRRVPPRGIIEDRQGRVLATNRQQLVVAVVPFEIRNKPEVLPLLARLLDRPLGEIEDILAPFRRSGAYDAIRVAEDMDIATVTRIEEQKMNLPGVYIYPEPVRAYPDGALFGHVLGQMGQIQPDELKRRQSEGYRPGDDCGKLGLEKQYDAQLRGENGGKEIEVDARGRMLRDVDTTEPVPGATLVLSIDKDLQKIAYDALAEWGTGRHPHAQSGGNPGAVVAMDPQTGGILALATYPSYDPNLFVKGISAKDWKSMQENPLKPQINRCVASATAPGSTFKVITATAGLETETCSEDTYEFCSGSISLGRWRKHCHHVHGTVGLFGAVAKSCDVFFYRLGQRLQPQRMADFSTRFGLGQKTGIDLPAVESAGVVPSPEWKTKHGRGPWVGGDTVDYAIGQASHACTPLQMCNVAAAIGNGGIFYRPRLVRSFRIPAAPGRPAREEIVKPEVAKTLKVSPQTLNKIRKAMQMVMQPGGTASTSAIPGIPMAGKTGTAQVHARGQGIVNNAWFIGYAPIDKPRIAICVFVEHAGHGGDVAAPIARQIIAKYFNTTIERSDGGGSSD